LKLEISDLKIESKAKAFTAEAGRTLRKSETQRKAETQRTRRTA
jgi:hypothetical protein